MSSTSSSETGPPSCESFASSNCNLSSGLLVSLEIASHNCRLLPFYFLHCCFCLWTSPGSSMIFFLFGIQLLGKLLQVWDIPNSDDIYLTPDCPSQSFCTVEVHRGYLCLSLINLFRIAHW